MGTAGRGGEAEKCRASAVGPNARGRVAGQRPTDGGHRAESGTQSATGTVAGQWRDGVFSVFFIFFLPFFVNRHTANVSSPITLLSRKIHDPNVPGVWMDRGFFSFAPEKLRVYRAVAGRRQQKALAWDAILSKAVFRRGGGKLKNCQNFGNKNNKYFKKCRLK